MSDQAADGQSEEEDIGDLQRQYNTVFVNELRRPEEVRPVSGVEGSLCAPGVAEVAVGDPHVGQDPGAAAVLVHQVDTHHHHQGAALLTAQVRLYRLYRLFLGKPSRRKYKKLTEISIPLGVVKTSVISRS